MRKDEKDRLTPAEQRAMRSESAVVRLSDPDWASKLTEQQRAIYEPVLREDRR